MTARFECEFLPEAAGFAVCISEDIAPRYVSEFVYEVYPPYRTKKGKSIGRDGTSVRRHQCQLSGAVNAG